MEMKRRHSKPIFQEKTLKQNTSKRALRFANGTECREIYIYIYYIAMNEKEQKKNVNLYLYSVIQWDAYIYEIYVHRVQFIYSFIYVILLSSSVICISI